MLKFQPDAVNNCRTNSSLWNKIMATATVGSAAEDDDEGLLSLLLFNLGHGSLPKHKTENVDATPDRTRKGLNMDAVTGIPLVLGAVGKELKPTKSNMNPWTEKKTALMEFKQEQLPIQNVPKERQNSACSQSNVQKVAIKINTLFESSLEHLEETTVSEDDELEDIVDSSLFASECDGLTKQKLIATVPEHDELADISSSLFVLECDGLTKPKLIALDKVFKIFETSQLCSQRKKAHVFHKLKLNWDMKYIDFKMLFFSDPTADRFQVTKVCVPNGTKLLLVSYYGEHVQTHTKKQETIKNLILQVEKLKNIYNCHAWIIGGDFNLPMKDAEDIKVENIEFSFDAQCKTVFGNSSDYVVYSNSRLIKPIQRTYPKVLGWSFENFFFPEDYLTTNKVYLADLQPRKNKYLSPFDHPRLLYQFRILKPPVEQTIKIEPSDVSPSDTAKHSALKQESVNGRGPKTAPSALHQCWGGKYASGDHSSMIRSTKFATAIWRKLRASGNLETLNEVYRYQSILGPMMEEHFVAYKEDESSGPSSQQVQITPVTIHPLEDESSRSSSESRTLESKGQMTYGGAHSYPGLTKADIHLAIFGQRSPSLSSSGSSSSMSTVFSADVHQMATFAETGNSEPTTGDNYSRNSRTRIMSGEDCPTKVLSDPMNLPPFSPSEPWTPLPTGEDYSDDELLGFSDIS